MDILAFARDYSNPAVVGAAIVFLLVSIKYLHAKLHKIETNDLYHLGIEQKEQTRSLGRIEGVLSELPCRRKPGQCSEVKGSGDVFGGSLD